MKLKKYAFAYICMRSYFIWLAFWASVVTIGMLALWAGGYESIINYIIQPQANN